MFDLSNSEAGREEGIQAGRPVCCCADIQVRGRCLTPSMALRMEEGHWGLGHHHGQQEVGGRGPEGTQTCMGGPRRGRVGWGGQMVTCGTGTQLCWDRHLGLCRGVQAG